MTDKALWGYGRWGYMKWGIYKPRFDELVKTVEHAKARSFKEIVKSLEA